MLVASDLWIGVLSSFVPLFLLFPRPIKFDIISSKYCVLAKMDPITVVHIADPASKLTDAKNNFPIDPPPFDNTTSTSFVSGS